MVVEFVPFGKPHPDLSNDRLMQVIAKKTLEACLSNKDFDVTELRHLEKDDGKVSDVIVVDCINDQVPSRNKYGIKVREQLALSFTPNMLPEVRALRKDFPVVPHLNHVLPDEPASLCLYFEPWSCVERTWTPQKHLQRILWWLSETAKGTLHKDDQPLEGFYFDSPFEVVLPPDFKKKVANPDLVLIPQFIGQSSSNFRVIRGLFISKKNAKTHEVPNIELLTINVSSPIVHGIIEKHPHTLGQLHEQFKRRGGPFLDELKNAIKEKAQGGLTRKTLGQCVLILNMPMKRKQDADPEKSEVRSFLLTKNLVALGEMTGALMSGHDGKFYAIPLIGNTPSTETTAWMEMEVCPVEVKTGVTKDFARKASAVNGDTADFKGVLAGVGALGSAIADLWAKECWGEWTFIDNDVIKAHNIVRHIAKDFHVGSFKVDVVKQIVKMNYHDDYYPANSIPKSANNITDQEVKNAITKAALFVDATTTIEVPRDMSQRNDVPRSVSVFLTPSGQGATLLIESADRTVRLDELEAQYYRAIICSDWGASHLDDSGNKDNLRVGAGCRDMSTIMSDETIQLHAAILARQVRLLRDQPVALIRVWSVDCETGAVEAHEVPVHDTLRSHYDEWKIIWDTGIKLKLCEIRNTHLPNETGGIILGYVDQKLKAIYIVDILKAPSDSKADRTGFTRGVEGLETDLKEVARCTANIVTYIGEWHSHPAFTSPYPSSADRALIEKLARTLALEGQPALMVIAGAAEDISISVKEE
jgi:integrative and conjugative element protein (TIGR02256 family)